MWPTSVSANTWKSYIFPALIFPFIALLTIFKLIDYDFWFHIKAGQIITETGHFLYKDTFTFTAAGRDWLYHEWLFGVLAYNTYHYFGANGIIIGKAAILILTFLVIFMCMRLRGVNPFLASFILFIAVLAARFRLTERAHIFKYLFVVNFIYLLDLYRLKGKNRLWLLPIIQVLWVNIHGSFIIGPLLIGIYLLSEAISPERKNSHICVLITILLVTSVSGLINPYGIRLLSFSLGFGEQTVLTVIGEWRRPYLIDFYGAFGLLFFTGIFSSILKYRQNKIVDLLLFCIFTYLSLRAIRFTALFSLATAPIIAENLQYLTPKINYTPIKKWIAAAISLSIATSLYLHEIKKYPASRFGLGESATIPNHAVDFLKQLKIQGNIYNFSPFGGYLIWRLYPERKVFVDGRPEIYNTDFQNAFIIGPSMNNWNKAIEVYDINYAIISYAEGKLDRIGDWISKDYNNWVLIYWDDIARIYVRNLKRNQEIITRYGHQVIKNAAHFNYNAIKDAIKKGFSDRIENELKTDISSNPANTAARRWLGTLYYETGRKQEAIGTWEDSIKIKPDAALYNNIGAILQEEGEHLMAVRYFKKAIEIDYRLAMPYYNIGKSYDALSRKDDAVKAYKIFLKYAGSDYPYITIRVKKDLYISK